MSTKSAAGQFAAASSDALWIRDAKTLQMEYASPSIASIYGVPPGALADGMQHWLALIVPEDRDIALEHIERARKGEAVVHEFRIRRPLGGSFRWIRDTNFPLRDGQGRIQRVGGIAEDVTEAKLAAEHKEVLVSELQHRVRNIMAIIRAITARTAGSAASVEEYRDLLTGRILALARVQALLTRSANQGGSLRQVIDAEISAKAEYNGQYELTGPDITLSPKAVEVPAMAVHELCTNAIKYGALSVPGGRVKVKWWNIQKDRTSWLELDWVEKGAPIITPPTRKGFGSELATGRIPYELGGSGTLRFVPEGLRCHLELPLEERESILETDAPPLTRVLGGGLDMTGAADLSNRTVLVVEDDFYLASDLAAALQDAGAEVRGPFATEADALQALGREAPTAAVVDLNLGGGGPRFTVARQLIAHSVPFLFLTGYDSDVIPPDLTGVRRIEKGTPTRALVEELAKW